MVSVSFAASSIVEQALEIFNTSQRPAKRIAEILILCDFEHFTKKDQIEVTFSLESDGTPAKGAKLVFERADPHLACQFCGRIFPYPNVTSISGFSLSCPRCGSSETQMMTFDVMVKKIKIV